MPEPIIRETVLKTTPDKVYAAFTDPSCIRDWFAEKVSLDEAQWRYDWPGGMAAEGRILETDPPQKFVWTWEKSIITTPEGVTHMMPSMVRLTYTFEAVEEGTRFTIEEAGHENEEIRAMNEQGIDGMLETLKAYLEDGQTVDWTAPPPEQ